MCKNESCESMRLFTYAVPVALPHNNIVSQLYKPVGITSSVHTETE